MFVTMTGMSWNRKSIQHCKSLSVWNCVLETLGTAIAFPKSDPSQWPFNP